MRKLVGQDGGGEDRERDQERDILIEGVVV